VYRANEAEMPGRSAHSSTMTLKTATLPALIGTILVTTVTVLNFIFNLLNVFRGLVPALTVVPSFIYAFGALTVAVFFYVFYKAQS
jgi:hypothetical protein